MVNCKMVCNINYFAAIISPQIVKVSLPTESYLNSPLSTIAGQYTIRLSHTALDMSAVNKFAGKTGKN